MRGFYAPPHRPENAYGSLEDAEAVAGMPYPSGAVAAGAILMNKDLRDAWMTIALLRAQIDALQGRLCG